MIRRRKIGWPSEQDIRELCGIWRFTVDGTVRRVVPYHQSVEERGDIPLTRFLSRENFNEVLLGERIAAVRLEPIPEQCIPKAARKEKYNVPFPLMRGEG